MDVQAGSGGQPAPEQSKSYVGEGAVLRGTRGPVIAQDHTSSVVGLAECHSLCLVVGAREREHRAMRPLKC